jgi:hypothetical protein
MLYDVFICSYNKVPIKVLITNSVALARERTVPTERLSLVVEVSANFLG